MCSDPSDPEAGFHNAFNKSTPIVHPSIDNAMRQISTADNLEVSEAFTSSEGVVQNSPTAPLKEATQFPDLTLTTTHANSERGTSSTSIKVRISFKDTNSSMACTIN